MRRRDISPTSLWSAFESLSGFRTDGGGSE